MITTNATNTKTNWDVKLSYLRHSPDNEPLSRSLFDLIDICDHKTLQNVKS